MPLTNEVFFCVAGIIIAILLAFLIPILVELVRLRGDIKPISALVNEVDSFFRQRGLNALAEGLNKVGSFEHRSLPQEKATERDALTAAGKVRQLNEWEVNRLKELLEEDARDEFAKGVLGILAFVVIMIGLSAIIKSLSQKGV